MIGRRKRAKAGAFSVEGIQARIAAAEAKSESKQAKLEARLAKHGIDFEAEEAAAAAAPRVTGRITGIQYDTYTEEASGSTADRPSVTRYLLVLLRVEWMGPDLQAGAVEVRCGSVSRGRDIADRYPSCFRLGALVEVVFGPAGPAVVSPFGSSPGRRVPERGLVGGAGTRDAEVDRWPVERVAVVSWERVSRVGVVTNWLRVTVRRADGSTATTKRSRVPGHVQFYVWPGAELSAAIDPQDPSEAAIDWAALAVERAGADAAGSTADLPPPGSLAAEFSAADGVAGMASGNWVRAAEIEALRATPLDPGDAIEGVTFAQHVKIEQYLATFRVAKEDHDNFAMFEFGVTPGRYSAIAAQWQQRFVGDERLREAYGDLSDRYQPLARQAAQSDGWTWRRRGDLDR